MDNTDSASTASAPTGVDERVAAIFEKHRRWRRVLVFSGIALVALVVVMFFVGNFVSVLFSDSVYHAVGTVLLISAFVVWVVSLIVCIVVGAVTAKCPACGDLMGTYPCKYCPLCSANLVRRGFFFCSACGKSQLPMILLDITFCPACGKRLR
jgi:hypothetical protein